MQPAADQQPPPPPQLPPPVPPPRHDPAAAANNNRAAAEALTLPPAFIEDPAAFLLKIASQKPTREGLAKLAGPVAKWFVSAGGKVDTTNGAATQVAPLYLQAAANQLQEMGGGMMATTTNNNDPAAMQQEMAKTKNQYETLEAVGVVAASLCPNRAAITSSGILPTLARLMVQSQSAAAAFMHEAEFGGGMGSSSSRSGGGGRDGGGDLGIGSIAAALFGHSSSGQDMAQSLSAAATTTCAAPSSMSSSALWNFPPLQQASVEFLQCALSAEQYRYAASLIKGTWPSPTSTVNVKTVLRYYYLRGMIHLGCQDYVNAHRCWWACLSVPSASHNNDTCSAIAIAAWKKLALVQPLLHHRTAVAVAAGSGAGTTGVLSLPHLPKSTPKALLRFLTTARDNRDESVLVYTRIGPAVEKGQVHVLKTLLSPADENANMTDADTTTPASAYPILTSDGNYGLAQECLANARRNQVWRASQLFAAVPVERLAHRWEIPVEQVPIWLLEASSSNSYSREVRCRMEVPAGATITAGDQNTGQIMVIFEQDDEMNGNGFASRDDDGTSSTPWMDLADWMHLLERIRHLDVSIATSPKYHSLVKRGDKGTSGGARGTTGAAAAAAASGSDAGNGSDMGAAIQAIRGTVPTAADSGGGGGGGPQGVEGFF